MTTFEMRSVSFSVGIATMLLASAAAAQQPIELKASVFAPASNPLAVSTEAWGKILEQKSNGRLKLKVFAASQMGPPPRQFDLARTGVADVAIVGHFITPGRFPLTDLLYIPGVLSAPSYASSMAVDQIAQETLAAEHPGVKLIGIGVINPQFIISKPPIRTPADLKGLRIRSSGTSNADLLSAIGAAPTSIQPAEMNDALAKGMIEGAVTAYSGVASYQLTDVAKSITEGPFGATTFGLVMSQASYDKLPADLKAIVDDTSPAAAQLLAHGLVDADVALRVDAIAKGAKIIAFQDDGTLAKASVAIREKAIAAAQAKGLDANGFLAKLDAATARHKDDK